MKRSRRVLEMEEKELKSVLQFIYPHRSFDSCTKADMQEELIHWLLTNGFTMSHKFLMFVDEDGEVWVLSKNETNCDCCKNGIQESASPIPNRLTPVQKPLLPRPGTLPLKSGPQMVYKPQRQQYPQGMQIFAPTPRSTDSGPATLSIDKIRSSGGVTRVEVPGLDEVDLKGAPQKPSREYQKTAKSLNVITTQPRKISTQVPVVKKDKSKKKKHRCKNFCIECGNCCVQLVRNT